MNAKTILELLNVHAGYITAGIGGPDERPYFDGLKAAADIIGLDNGLLLEYDKSEKTYYYKSIS